MERESNGGAAPHDRSNTADPRPAVSLSGRQTPPDGTLNGPGGQPAGTEDTPWKSGFAASHST